MLVAFIDESYPSPRDKYFVSAVVMDMLALFEMGKGFREVIAYASTSFKIDPSAELHAHEIMQQKNEWKPIAGMHRAATSIYKRGLRVISDSGARVFLEGVDVVRLNARYGSYADDPHEVALRHVLERVNDYARLKNETVLVVADECDGQAQHAAIVELFSRIGTPGYRSSRLLQIEQPVRFDDSCAHAGLQAADLAVYLYQRKKSVVETHPEAQKAIRQMWSALSPAVKHERLWTP